METYTRTREHGTQETLPGNPLARIEAIRAVVEHKQYAKIDGLLVDLFSASAIVKVYDALNIDNQHKFASYPAGKMAELAFKLIK